MSDDLQDPVIDMGYLSFPAGLQAAVEEREPVCTCDSRSDDEGHRWWCELSGWGTS